MAPMLFADTIVTEKPLKVFNNGEMEQDFTYIDDIVEGVLKVTENIPGSDAEQPYYRILNIGNSRPLKLMVFIFQMENAFGSKALKEMHPMQPGDVVQTYADTSELKELVDYKTKSSTKNGLPKFVEWYKNYYLS